LIRTERRCRGREEMGYYGMLGFGDGVVGLRAQIMECGSFVLKLGTYSRTASKKVPVGMSRFRPIGKLYPLGYSSKLFSG
jgi:hypothetical protein